MISEKGHVAAIKRYFFKKGQRAGGPPPLFARGYSRATFMQQLMPVL